MHYICNTLTCRVIYTGASVRKSLETLSIRITEHDNRLLGISEYGFLFTEIWQKLNQFELGCSIIINNHHQISESTKIGVSTIKSDRLQDMSKAPM